MVTKDYDKLFFPIIDEYDYPVIAAKLLEENNKLKKEIKNLNKLVDLLEELSGIPKEVPK